MNVIYKPITRLNLSVRPPDGHVRLSVPLHTSTHTIETMIRERRGWILSQQERIQRHWKAAPLLQVLDGETHYVWGLPYRLLLSHGGRSKVSIDRDLLRVNVPATHNEHQRWAVLNRWYRQELSKAIPALVMRWSYLIGREPAQVAIRKMKCKWGSCRPQRGMITLNVELVKYHPTCLEYVLVHELVHLIEQSHNHRFKQLLHQYLPDWEKRKALLDAPLGGRSSEPR